MAFLMLLHEKMRLQRRQNKLTLKQLRMGNMLSRVKNKIEKRQKYYSKLEKNLETQVTLWKNRMKASLQQGCGYASNTLGMGMGSIFGGSGQQLQVASTMDFSAYKAEGQAFAGSNVDLNNQVALYIQNGGRAYKGSEIKSDSNYLKQLGLEASAVKDDMYYISNGANGNYSFTAAQYEALANMKGAVDNNVYQAQSYYNYGIQSIEEQASIWLQYQKEQLDMQSEYEMDLLAEEENDYEMEKTGIEAELEIIKQRKEAIQQELADAAKDTAPRFGLA